MAVRSVITWGDPRLRANSTDVGEWTAKSERLVEDLFETTLAEKGVGLAAPQIGQNFNIAVIDISCGADPARKILLLNPEIVRTEGVQMGPEGCLSIPGVLEILGRPRKVWVKNRRRDGVWEELVGEDLLARAICHEIDHLRGKLFVDYLGPVKRAILQRKYLKQQKKSP